MSDVAIFAAGIATMGLSLTLLVGLFPRLFFAEHDRQVAERAWDAAIQHQWEHRPIGNRSPHNPYTPTEEMLAHPSEAAREHLKEWRERRSAPTDDEREALLIERLQNELEYRVRTAVALAKGAHGHGDQVTEGRAAVARIAAGFRRTVQGEPTCDHDWQNRVAGGSKCSKCDLWQDKRVPPKGEPTDAQIEAAMREHDYSLDRETTRNVLRAAAAVRGEQ